ncbi:unnamed protein product [Cyprideis torosa]|uniref:Translocon-associated protein subunit gamma n=1 Tax=Cyprideis torosa TaxID=163714 RepID=A0A7R8W346_9CRUS|nr:unnamed protein product [Cyprideis torosa]CAG0882615.1 unnamed protein product [Cyprideis torosa]
MGKAKAALSKEEELLLQDCSRHVSRKSSLLFYGNALVVSVLPICKCSTCDRLFWRIHSMDPIGSALFLAVGSLASTWLVAFAYRNTKFIMKHKVALRREEAVTREMTKKLGDDKKMSKKEKDDRILWKKSEVSDYEATTLSIFYNNALFILLVVCLSFYPLRSLAPIWNYVGTILGASGAIALLSTGSK